MSDQAAVDKIMLDLDGTENKGKYLELDTHKMVCKIVYIIYMNYILCHVSKKITMKITPQ